MMYRTPPSMAKRLSDCTVTNERSAGLLYDGRRLLAAASGFAQIDYVAMGSVFAEETAPHVVIARQVGAAESVVQIAGWISTDEGQRPGAYGIGFGPLSKE